MNESELSRQYGEYTLTFQPPSAEEAENKHQPEGGKLVVGTGEVVPDEKLYVRMSEHTARELFALLEPDSGFTLEPAETSPELLSQLYRTAVSVQETVRPPVQADEEESSADPEPILRMAGLSLQMTADGDDLLADNTVLLSTSEDLLKTGTFIPMKFATREAALNCLEGLRADMVEAQQKDQTPTVEELVRKHDPQNVNLND